MRVLSSFITASALTLSLAGVAAAQDSSMQGHDMSSMTGITEMALPEACQTAAAPPDMPGMEDMEAAMQAMNENQRAMMQGMMETHDPMMQGMMAEDTDIAFACGMIPHHRGAINMAEVELQHGDSDEMKELAQKIIEDQQREIEQLTQWIEEQGTQ